MMAERRDRPRRATPPRSSGIARTPHDDGRDREPATRASVSGRASARPTRARGSSEPRVHRSRPARRHPRVHGKRGTSSELRLAERDGSPVGPQGWPPDPPSRQPPHLGAAGPRQGRVVAPGVTGHGVRDRRAGSPASPPDLRTTRVHGETGGRPPADGVSRLGVARRKPADGHCPRERRPPTVPRVAPWRRPGDGNESSRSKDRRKATSSEPDTSVPRQRLARPPPSPPGCALCPISRTSQDVVGWWVRSVHSQPRRSANGRGRAGLRHFGAGPVRPDGPERRPRERGTGPRRERSLRWAGPTVDRPSRSRDWLAASPGLFSAQALTGIEAAAPDRPRIR